MLRHPRLTQIEEYEQFVGAETTESIIKKARSLRRHVADVNSTYYGGGVAELLTSLTGTCRSSRHSPRECPPA